MKIAVVGSGIAGLSAAWLLSQQHDVTIFEKAPRLGMDAHGIDVDLGDGSSARIDVPLRVFSESYYVNLTSLYERVGVQFKAENYASSFTSVSGRLFFIYRNLLLGNNPVGAFLGSLWRKLRGPASTSATAAPNGGVSVPFTTNIKSLNPWAPNWAFLRILYDFVRFLFKTPAHFQKPELAQQTFREYLEAEGYSREFADYFLVPGLSGMCTCSFESVEAYPANIIVDYMVARSMRGVRRACFGAKDVVSRLSADCKEVFCNCAVTEISFDAGTVHLADSQGRRHVFDHVIVATQANQAVQLLKQLTPDHPSFLDRVTKSLAAFPYESSLLTLHTDERLMPCSKSDWRPVNFIIRDDDDEQGDADAPRETMATIWMNEVQPSMGTRKNIFQTWNPIVEPAPETVICSATFERPVVTQESVRAMKQLDALQGEHGLWFVGSYALPGVPLLETAVSSSVEIASRLGVEAPWKKDVGSGVAAGLHNIDVDGEEGDAAPVKAVGHMKPWKPDRAAFWIPVSVLIVAFVFIVAVVLGGLKLLGV